MHESNPLLDWELRPDFSLIAPEHVVPAMQEVIARSSAELEALEQAAPRTWHGLLVPLERLTDRVSRAWGLITHLHNVKNSPAMRQAFAQSQPLVVEFHNRLGQSRPVYDALVALRESPEFDALSQALQRVITLLIRDAALQGVGLSPEKREEFNAVSQKLADLSTRFTNNVLDATQAYALTLTEKDQVTGLPEDSLRLAANMARTRGQDQATAENGPWCITLDLPSFLSFMQHASRRDLREEVYRAYITRAASGENDNLPLIQRILELRRELACLLGYENFAAVSLERKMAPGVNGIESLLGTIQGAATDPAINDLIELGELARSHGQSDDIAPWDVMYWAERLKEQRFGLRDDLIRPYFPLPAILGGLFELIEELFEVRIEIAANVPVWHKDVSYYRVMSREDREIAGFYLDPYARPEEKRGGAWMDELCGRSTVCAPSGHAVRLPVAYVNCNQRPALDEAPPLMSFQEVTTLFHEFGHALQHMLTTVEHGFVAGIANVEWDAVELASQFMENWCYHPRILSGLARHYQTGEPMDKELLDKLLETRTFRAGSNALRQVCFALTDLALHTANPETLDPIITAQRIARDILPLPPLPEDRFLCSFSHIFAGGYAAGYYSYKWAEVLSADAFGAFEEAGTDPARRQKLGRRFRDTILSLGGSRHPMEVFRLFRGREPDPHALLRQEGLLQENKEN